MEKLMKRAGLLSNINRWLGLSAVLLFVSVLAYGHDFGLKGELAVDWHMPIYDRLIERARAEINQP